MYVVLSVPATRCAGAPTWVPWSQSQFVWLAVLPDLEYVVAEVKARGRQVMVRPTWLGEDAMQRLGYGRGWTAEDNIMR